MNDFELTAGYYLNTALQAMDLAHNYNQDRTVGAHISRAIEALRILQRQVAAIQETSGGSHSDPYELNEFNSAI